MNAEETTKHVKSMNEALEYLACAPGVRVEAITLYERGQRVAGLVLYGCHWDRDGYLAISLERKP